MGRYRSRSRSYSPRRKRYDEPRDRYRSSSYRSSYGRSSSGPSGLLIRNISLDARPEDLRIPFERFGPVKDVYLPRNYYTGEPRGFGFVKFHSAEDAAEAMEHMNHKIIGGREIRIVFAEENRKTPQEMRVTTRISDRRRRSSPRSPRRQYHSYSRSPSPSWGKPRNRVRDSRNDDYTPRRGRSISRSLSPQRRRSMSRSPPSRGRSISRSPPRGKISRARSPPPRGKSISKSPPPRGRSFSGSPPPRGRSISRSPPPREGSISRSPPPRGRSISRSFSPRGKRPISKSRSPRDVDYMLGQRSPSPRENGRNRPRSRSFSPR